MITETSSEGVLANLNPESLTVQGLAIYPSSGLGGGRSLTCTFSSAVGQAEVRRTPGHRLRTVSDVVLSTGKAMGLIAF